MADTIPTSGTYTLSVAKIASGTFGTALSPSDVVTTDVTFNNGVLTYVDSTGSTVTLTINYSWGADGEEVIVVSGSGGGNYYYAISDPSVDLSDYTYTNNTGYAASQYSKMNWILTSSSDSNNKVTLTTDSNLNANGDWTVCFLAGTLIRTANGDLPVEQISVGDEVFAYEAGDAVKRKVVWVGRAETNVKPWLPDDMAGYPIRVLRDALAEGVPYKDMLITPEHSLFFGDFFIPVRMLVNGRSIIYDKTITSYDYYHVETELHSVIMADGILTESYLDTGNRKNFRCENNVSKVNFTNKTWTQDSAAPLVNDRLTVESIFRSIESRAVQANIRDVSVVNQLINDADLQIVTQTGVNIRNIEEKDGWISYVIPPAVDSVNLVTRASRPSDVTGPFVDDRRYLGVLVGDITLTEAGKTQEIRSHLNEDTVAGWHALESPDFRWTDGNATLPLPKRGSGNATLSLKILAGGPYLASDRIEPRPALKA
ncbi:Hint domain-containing protein [Acetobacter sacchari]|uniref:Hint domain-containing protein n=1 Tax=Acetobacter sacchari TaxID=2661687 RepID=A0ABS3LX17_9PROT|nr:Hint domain-containing protein [Acetobacter sacchari]MBO1360469.1 Hint domain-containing protein [Acetobacter sacchari]